VFSFYLRVSGLFVVWGGGGGGGGGGGLFSGHDSATCNIKRTH